MYGQYPKKILPVTSSLSVPCIPKDGSNNNVIYKYMLTYIDEKSTKKEAAGAA